MEKTLDFETKHHTTYAIPMWLRDEQIRSAISRVKGRIQGPLPKRDDPIAIVCYGPSLADTWEKVKDFKYIFTGSGSHKFLLEHGLVPQPGCWFHAEVDPRPHKVELMGPPHKDIEYLIASTCHPKLFEHLQGFNLKLWHIFDSAEDGLRVLPRGEWALTGGQNVGLRQMTIASFFGFRDLHVFGMDGCQGKTGKHAAAHPMQAKKASTTEYKGVTYETTPAFLECAKRTFYELDNMPGVNATFYGEGLVQHMARDYVRKAVPPEAAIIAFNKPEVISSEYASLNAQLHRENLTYGVGGAKHAERVLKMAEAMKTHSILDYGCGKGHLAKAIPFPIWEYDPAIPGKQDPPRPADFCICTDVLEHVEPEHLEIVLDDLRRCTKLVGFFVIHTGPASKTLPDGRNTHLIQQDKDWWSKKLGRYFNITKIILAGPEVQFVVYPKDGKVTANVARLD